MPIYTVRNTKTDKQYDVDLKMKEFEDFLRNNPDIVQVFVKMNIGDPIKLGIKKPPADFMKGVIAPMQEKYGKNHETKFKVPKEI